MNVIQLFMESPLHTLTRALLLIVLCADFTGCGGGGGGDDTPSVFDGHYSGRLTGTSCISNLPVDILVEHEVDATGDGGESEATVVVFDEKGTKYTGPVILTANTVAQIWGFSAEAAAGRSDESADNIFYNIANTRKDEADVEERFVIPEGDPRVPSGCSYTLQGLLTKSE